MPQALRTKTSIYDRIAKIGQDSFLFNLSMRSRHPFVSINCAANPEQLLESELSGYAEGSFTGSKKGAKPGLFEIAHQGFIFLDELDSWNPQAAGSNPFSKLFIGQGL